jgi:hypothetical protein
MYIELVNDVDGEWQELKVDNEVIHANHNISGRQLLTELEKYLDKFIDKNGHAPTLQGVIVRDI